MRVISVVLLLLLATTLFAQAKWALAKEKNGIKVFTAKQPDAKYKSIKVEAVLTGTLDKLVHLLIEAESNKDWIYGTTESYVIKKISAAETLSYTETSVPWPASNRDVPIYMKLTLEPAANSLKVIAKGVPDAVPAKPGIVRIPFFSSSWNVRFDGKNKLFINYFLEVDPGGNVPAWIYNMFVARGPYETFNKLAGLLK